MKSPKRILVHERLATDLPYGAKVRQTMVDDPYSQEGGRILVLQSRRDDQLVGLHARGKIDDAQFQAGRKWEEYEEAASIGGASAIDPTKEAVDGGKIPEPFTDRHLKAIRRLAEARSELGPVGYSLVKIVLSERLTVREAAFKLGYESERGVNYVSIRFRECLEVLAILWGLAGEVDNRCRPIAGIRLYSA